VSLDLDKLERLAWGAQPGPWSWENSEVIGADDKVLAEVAWSDADAEYIAAVDPPTVLALIAALRAPQVMQVAPTARRSRVSPGAWGVRNQAAYPIRDAEGRPAWQGIVVIEPDDYLWRCPHAHDDHREAVRCAAEHESTQDQAQP